MKKTTMQLEALEAPTVISEQYALNKTLIEKVGQHLRLISPKFVTIIGRGSSDHAGVFAKYLIEIELGIPTSAAAPSVSSVYKSQLKLCDSLAIIISQSGRSPDIITQAKMAKKGGAYCVALINDESSPLKDIVDEIIPLKAGKEVAVAATKSYLATLAALINLVAYWKKSPELRKACVELPSALRHVIASRPQLDFKQFSSLQNMVILSRGLGLAIAKEMALKMKEVCGIHAEAFSSAEFIHGPVALVEKGLKILNCEIIDESFELHSKQIKEVEERKAIILHIHQSNISVHPRIAPLLVLQRFYLDIAVISVALGLDPDSPKGLNKVTETL